jgi:hypothetical protein
MKTAPYVSEKLLGPCQLGPLFHADAIRPQKERFQIFRSAIAYLTRYVDLAAILALVRFHNEIGCFWRYGNVRGHGVRRIFRL